MPEPTLDDVVASFRAAHPLLDAWSRWPDVTDDEYLSIDTFECIQVAEAFTAHARAAGLPATVVTTAPDEDALDGFHAWTVLTLADGAVGVDWTARQFWNLHEPARPEHADLPCPLLWPASGVSGLSTHPVANAPVRLAEPANRPSRHEFAVAAQ